MDLLREEIPAPVEYAVAVDRFLDAAQFADSSRRIYRIALETWGWALVGRLVPVGPERRNAPPPVVPLALLDDRAAATRLGTALTLRAQAIGVRTLTRELSILRSAIAWWRTRGWIGQDCTLGLEPGPSSPRETAGPSRAQLAPADLNRVFALRVGLREQTFWHLVHESAAPISALLTLDVSDLDIHRRRTRANARVDAAWGSGAGRLLPLLLAGRPAGPVFLTDRHASQGAAGADRCPLTGRARLSYRRAAELFTQATRPLDPMGRGWTLHQLRTASHA